MKSILFVDDEPMVLQALQRMLHSMRREWDMRFAGGGAEALDMMAHQPADVVVSDMRMPRMSGAQLLNEVMRLHPKTARFILSGFADFEMVMQCVGGTHQFLSKPCDSETLRVVVGRTIAMDGWLKNDDLKTLVSQLGRVPSMPALYFKILKELEGPDAALEKIGATIAQDPGMTAKMLHLVNSAFFGLRRQLTDPTEAVVQLGLETVKSLVLGIHVFSQFEGSDAMAASLDRIWHHSLATAATARRIAAAESQDAQLIEECFTAGLLHDIGRVVLLANLPGRYAEAVARSAAGKIPLMEAERAVFGATHAQVGGYLLGLWGLPVRLVEAVAFHHSPAACQDGSFTQLTAVHAANVFEQIPAVGQDPALLPQLDGEYLARLGLAERVPAWRNLSENLTQPA